MKITVSANESNTKNILSLLEEMGISLPCNCHGKHHCNGTIYSFDCSFIPKEPTTITLPDLGEHIQGISLEHMPKSQGIGDTLLIDLGTTTIALALIRKDSGTLLQTHVFSNPQNSYGADIISRIQSAMEGNGRTLTTLIQNKIEEETKHLCKINNQSVTDIAQCFIGGNTAMIHLLMGYDCQPLSASPFTIKESSPKTFSYNSCEIHIMPWITAFIGGDITAGMIACNMEENTSLLMDLGTNGELLLHHNGNWYATSTAAGPAFEGNGISCGCAAISGAICKVELKRLRPILSTIDNKIPVGLCGSGALSLCSELINNGYVTKEGILTECFHKGGIILGKTKDGKTLAFTPEDFRHMQPAIAAVAAGIETLCHESGLHSSDIEKVFLGGGFGFHLDFNTCQTLGMFSAINKASIIPMGNTCLQGLYSCAVNNISPDNLPNVIHVELADNSFFKESFLRHMTYADEVISTT